MKHNAKYLVNNKVVYVTDKWYDWDRFSYVVVVAPYHYSGIMWREEVGKGSRPKWHHGLNYRVSMSKILK